MTKAMRVFLFGDLNVSFEESLRELLYTKDMPVLKSFLEKVAFALREEISRMSSSWQALMPRFTTLIDLLPQINGKIGSPALRFALLCVAELGLFIRFHERRSIPYPTGDNSCLLGICTGSFAAAAVAVSRGLTDLVPAGVEATLVALRTATLSLQCRFDMCNMTETGSSCWSAIVNLTEEDATKLVDAFCEAHPRVSRPYLSAVSPTNVTISANPQVLDDFLAFAKVQFRKLSIESPYHAPQLFPEVVCLSTVKKYHDSQLEARQLHVPLLLPSGAECESRSFEDVLKASTLHTLHEKVRWDRVIETVCTLLQQRKASACEIIPVLSNAPQLLFTHIPRKCDIQTVVSDLERCDQGSAWSNPTGKFEQSKIAIIGFSGRYPDSSSNDEFWELLRAGRDVHKRIPEDRFDWEAHFDPTGKKRNTSRVQYGCFIKEPGVFDTRFFNMSPREAASTDPAQRLLITSTYEALEMAGFVPNRTPSSQVDRVGVFMGTTSDDWREVNSGQDVDTYFIPGGNRAFIPGRISYFFKFSGPSLSIDTACSSSFSAIHAACAYLWKGDCDTAIAGGTNVLTNPDNFAGLDRGHFLSTTGNCKPFDDAADGYCRADAVGCVILKRYEDAVADNDPVYGLIAGAHTNHCGQAESITRPHEGDQASVFNRVLRYTNQDPRDVSYVEMHGTGTQAGDATEMNSVLSCFVRGKQRTAEYPLYIGSAKANIGHAESASGVSSLIKVLLMMKHNEIPPHCGIKGKINHNYPDLKALNVHIAFKPTPWTREGCVGGKRIAFLNNFSAAGGNTALLLEDGPVRATPAKDISRSIYPVAVSAKSAKSLERNVKAMIAFLEANPDTALPSLSYTTTARRIHHNFRTMVSGTDLKSIKLELDKILSSLPEKPIPNAALLPKIAFAFTGQGSLYVGVTKELFDADEVFRSEVLRLDIIAQQHGLPSFIPLLDGSASARQLEQPTMAHVGHTALQIALTNMWSRFGISPALVIGHSLGEYAALYAAGVLTASDAIYLVGSRARLLEQSCTPRSHAMISVKASMAAVEPIVQSGSSCEIACVNQPDATVLSGPREEIDCIMKELETLGHKCIKLEIPYAFHSAQVDPILEPLGLCERAVQFSNPKIPFLSPMMAAVITEVEPFKDAYLTKACRKPVNFHAALQAAQELGIVGDKTLWLEIGPHPLCAGMIKATLGSDSVTMPTLTKRQTSLASVVVALQDLYIRGIAVDWNEYYRQDATSLQVIELPQYKWDLKNYWIQYKNNFCLTKGDSIETKDLSRCTVPTVEKTIITPAVQHIIEISKEKASIVTETDISHSALSNVIQGHKVNGIALCPSSLYADMAMTVCEQLCNACEIRIEESSFEVGSMNVKKPLIADGSTQLLRVSATADFDSREIDLSFYSVSASGTKLADHATCKARIRSKGSRDDWQRMSFLIKHRLEALEASVDHGTANKMKRGIVYKLFSALVDYSQGYRGMEEVTLDSSALEATAKVRFQCGPEGYVLNPQWIDCLGHIAGFIMNGNDSVASRDTVFVNHGWENMQIATKFSEDKTYRTYNKMQLTTNNIYVGDTYILEGDEIVAIYSGIKFQGVPRRVLDQLLPSGQRRAIPVTTTPAPKLQEAKISNALSKGKSISSPKHKVSSIKDTILNLIAEAVGLDVNELKPDTTFDECGVDSLLSLNISKAMHDQLGLDINSSTFAECPTISSFLSRVKENEASPGTLTPQSSNSSTTDLDSLLDDNISLASSITSDEDEKEEPLEKSTNKTIELIRSVIAAEVGLEPSEIGDSTNFSDLGIDSLLSLNIMSRLEEIIESEIPRMLLAENETLEKVARALGLQTTVSNVTLEKQKQKLSNNTSETKFAVRSPPHASSHLLQGNAKTATKKLFLFPDGSGSAFSYASLSRISPSVAVYGLACPWQKDPWSMAGVSFSQLSAKFIAAIKKIQPCGPYHLGGWSAGGISAYDAAQQLAADGDVVESLVLIDSPNPIGLENPPQRMYDFFDELDFFGMEGKAPPTWLRAHFDAFLTTLDEYKIAPWKQGNSPATYIVYAKNGVCDMLKPEDPRPEIRDDDPREMKWLLNTRTDFSATGWKSLVGDCNVSVGVIEGVNHFSMMNKGPKSDELADFIKSALKM
ncbi:uncharacterized protein PV09_06930 [Verruconis gallopava]|uniref:Carrier domain-containing protein n=1 Tax=Verruconis gallopava TaxID=253628 RepID=A0A0D2ARC5_9PEZI|nr:uncharacterized protein PV09_06930 [Verruconis gallopava]KIW01754.1 hypothetical protein PV09_06930 [Verruconis gallopava]